MGGNIMRALVFDGALHLVSDRALPCVAAGEALIRVLAAGICRTDLELTRGYMGFTGVLGHEFVGRVEHSPLPGWVGKRVVGEINAACGVCVECARGLGRHCAHRTVLGIQNRDGCMADYMTLPLQNLHPVPDDIGNDSAVFTEPLAAAYEILEQVPIKGSERAMVLGDGKLGILCAWVLATVLKGVVLVGHHPSNLRLAQWGGLDIRASSSELTGGFDLVVEATGSEKGLIEAMRLCRPRGVIVLKSTLATQGQLNLAPVVINELQVVGSRCGPFDRALNGLTRHRFPVQRLISGRYPLDDGVAAFEHAARRGTLKVVVGTGAS